MKKLITFLDHSASRYSEPYRRTAVLQLIRFILLVTWTCVNVSAVEVGIHPVHVLGNRCQTLWSAVWAHPPTYPYTTVGVPSFVFTCRLHRVARREFQMRARKQPAMKNIRRIEQLWWKFACVEVLFFLPSTCITLLRYKQSVRFFSLFGAFYFLPLTLDWMANG